MIPDKLKALLLGGINPGRVGKAQGRAHVEAYEIRAHLIRMFDFDGWDQRITANQLVFESENADGKWTVCYRAQCELRVRWPEGGESVWVEWATGDSQNQPSRSDAHDMALKTAESQALKRCAMNLGDQFGLSLYRKGSTAPIVRLTWNMEAATSPEAAPRVDAHITESVPESDEPEAAPDLHEQSTPAAEPAEDARSARVADLTQQILQAAEKGRAAVAGVTGQVMKEKLGTALTYDADDNAVTLGALCDQALKRVTQKVPA